MTLAYRCAIAPLDQSTTTIGWHPGFYRRSRCGVTDCNWWDSALQFLADPGTPVVAPVPLTVLSTSPLVVMPTIPWTDTYGRISHWGDPSSLDRLQGVRIRGVVPAVARGAVLDKGALLGRIASQERGTKWSVWQGGRDVDGIVSLFHDLGLEVVGEEVPNLAGFDRTPGFGGRLLARARGPADCSAPLQGLGRLEVYFAALGTGIAPPGFVEPDGSVYGRYGRSAQSDTTPPNPSHENVSPAAAGVGIGGVLAILGALGAWWYARR